MTRPCRLCSKEYKDTRYATCSSCRRNKNKKDDGIKRCSRCRKVEIVAGSKFKTCEGCREDAKKNRIKKMEAKSKIDDVDIMSSPVTDSIKSSETDMSHIEMKELFQKHDDGELELKPKTEEFDPFYLGGMWDGDGTVTICGNKEAGFVLQVSFSQAIPQFLHRVQANFGGKVYMCKEPDKDVCKQMYGYRVCGKASIPLLKVLEKGCIIKYNQVKLALEYISLIDKPGKVDQREMYCRMIRKLNEHEYYEVEKPYERVCDAYIAGIFDAEGYIGVSNVKNTLRAITISQRNDPVVLSYIKEYLTYGKVDKKDDMWIVYDKVGRINFMKLVEPYIMIKLDQVTFALKHCEDDHTKDDKHALVSLLQTEKHRSIVVPRSRIIRKNKSDDVIKNRLKKARKAAISAKTAVKSWNNGEKNSNYGKKMSVDRKNKMGRAIADAKRSYTDDDMEMMKQLVKDEGYTYAKLAEMYGIDRHTVSSICRGIIKPLKQYEEDIESTEEEEISDSDEEDTFIKKLVIPDDIKTSIGKRRIDDFSLIIDILLLKNKMPSTHVVKKYNWYKNPINAKKITTDVVKNIWSGKTELYEHEFREEKITYDQYLEIKENKITNKRGQINGGISNRSVTFETAIDIIMLKGTAIAKNIGKKFTKKDDNPVPENTVTKLFTGKTKLYEHEFTNDCLISYKEYLNIINTPEDEIDIKLI